MSDAKGELAAAVAALREFVKALKKRPDVEVTEATLGKRAKPAELARLAKLHALPEALVALYAELDGAHVEWRFVEPPGGGRLRIPPLSEWTRFEGDDKTYMNFGDAEEALLLDEIEPEGGTWLVRSREGGPARVLFASSGRGHEGMVAAGSLAEYLRKAMESGFVSYWPRCFTPSPWVSYAEQEESVKRFRAPPVKPGAVRVGARVQCAYFSEQGRGEVLARHTAREDHSTVRFCGPELARVRLDAGGEGWLPLRWLKALRKVDAYERLRDPAARLAPEAAEALPARLDELARALGPLTHYSGAAPSNARRAAGLLGSRPFAQAAEVACSLAEFGYEARFRWGERRAVPRSPEDFVATQFATTRYEYEPTWLLEGLWGGLALLAQAESARRGCTARELLEASLVARLEKRPRAQALAALLREEKVLEAPRWHHGDSAKYAQELGLPEGSVVLLGTGY